MKNFFKVLSVMFLFILTGCHFFTSVTEEIIYKDYNADITAVTFNATTMSITKGESDYLKLTLSPSAKIGRAHV